MRPNWPRSLHASDGFFRIFRNHLNCRRRTSAAIFFRAFPRRWRAALKHVRTCTYWMTFSGPTRERLFVGVLALAGGVLGGIIPNSSTGRRAPATPAAVTATKFVLVDQTGKRRAQLSVSEHQTANLDLYDANGASRAQLVVLRDGTTVFTFSDDR